MIKQDLRVNLFVSEPWDYGEGPYCGYIYSVENRTDSCLFRLMAPVFFEGQRAEYFVVRPRGKELDLIEVLLLGKRISCNVTMIPTERAIGPNPLDLSWWRGGVALVGDLKKSETK